MKFHAAWIAAAAIGLMGCATTYNPDISIDYDHSADLASYRTFGFTNQLGTDRAGYTTLVTKYFKDAVSREMEKRGYEYDPTDPDLLVNFYTNVREVNDVHQAPYMPYMGYSYFNYRYGLYGTWPLYENAYPVTYKVGTVSVDIVDGEKMQLVWQGVAEGRITQEDMKNQQQAIDAAVGELFQRFSGTAAPAKG
jgi:Domain of unknown function (DUF4136)